jgi:hypothetical protein
MKQIKLKDIENLLLKLPHELRVSFAVHCAEDCIDNYTFKDKQTLKHCIDLCKKWLINKNSVSKAELEAAANSANSANSAYSAAYSAYSAANSAAYSAKMNEYYKYLLELTHSLYILDKVLWNLE